MAAEDTVSPAPIRPGGTPTAATFDAIIAAPDLPTETVTVEPWGLTLKIRSISRGELRRVNDKLEDGSDPSPELVSARMMVAAVVSPSLTVEQALEILDKKSMQGVKIVEDAILEVSGLNDLFPSGS